ncbi:type II secretion system protein [Janthinobacterium agaricidamnosum]|uniref:Prepilin-type N-terminal cleavage/methylation domain protein n=1 Tax=Janthinobacterium agaricidamnosum NBRC 102515 = DSM 9628 TaxID=1349767 RepID=W0V656_9BURK|nr:type II secretion system protein [Janthinobacterium agaricidamnosum]CDG82752.1 prepilin-type N-terminal cleavage/methylation domain protein [Janthinobacterium agaricidamnosum NBRC 102515 = DSM 9628]
MSIYRRATARRGFTLIELIVFILIVGIAVAGLVKIFSFTTSRSADPQLRKQALALAEGMLEEVELARFTFCDPLADPAADTASGAGACSTPQQPRAAAPATGRPYYNVSDYVRAFNQAVSYSTDAAGNKFPAGYTVNVTINPDAGLGPSGATVPSDATPANMNALRITVAVSYANGSVALTGYRTRYAPNAIP